MPNSDLLMDQSVDWLGALDNLAYANKRPQLKGILKSLPEDFQVTEMMEVEPCGEGEHYWLDVSKVKCNTEQVAKALAKFAHVSNRDVGYSGMKDFFAQTRQWFSVWKPKGGQPAWQEFSLEGVTIHRVEKHVKKIKRGTHAANKFRIVVRQIEGDLEELETRLIKVKEQGVPNYFGPQRFGRNGDNMQQAVDLFAGNKKIKSRHLRGILLSAARSWLFNEVVSGRVKDNSFLRLNENEPTNLHGSNSVFKSVGDGNEVKRLADLDIHPTAPMWGKGGQQFMQDYSASSLFDWEQNLMSPLSLLQEGLEQANLDYQRRSIRSIATNLQWSYEAINGETDLVVSFDLIPGQFATSILREIVVV